MAFNFNFRKNLYKIPLQNCILIKISVKYITKTFWNISVLKPFLKLGAENSFSSITFPQFDAIKKNI